MDGNVVRIINGWGTFISENSNITASILPKMVQENNLKENDQIKVNVQPNSDGSKIHIIAIIK